MSGIISGIGNINHWAGGLLGINSKKAKDPATPPPAPTASNTAATADAAAEEELRRRQAGGRSSTILNGPTGVSDMGTVSSSGLLGS